MKYFITLFLTLSINFVVFGQSEKFKVHSGEFEPLIQSVTDMKTEEIYNKSIEWINYTFKNANVVIGSSVKNEMLHFTGIKRSFAKSFGYLYDLEFSIRIEFKENKYRLTVENLRTGVKGIFSAINLNDYYNSDGTPRKAYKTFINEIENTLNELNLSLYNSLNEKSEKW